MSLLEMQTLEPCPWTRTYIFMDDFCRKCLKGTGIATCRKSRTLVTFERNEKTLQGLWSWTYWHTQNWNYTKQLRLPCGMCVCVCLCVSVCLSVFVPGILQARTMEWIAIPFSRGIFPTQGSNPGLLHCRQFLYHLSYQGSPCGLTLNTMSFYLESSP